MDAEKSGKKRDLRRERQPFNVAGVD